MKQLPLRRIWNTLAVAGLAFVTPCCSVLAPDIAARQQLADLQQAALEGNRLQIKKFLEADVAAHWPAFAGRVVVAQGDGADATPKDEFMRDFSRAYLLTQGGLQPDLENLREVGGARYTAARQDNEDGVPTTRPVVFPSRSFAVIAIPSAVCRSCAKLPPAQSMSEQCQPIHPDLLFAESRYRMKTLFHEEGHAVRMMMGVSAYKTQFEQHREEVIVDIYAEMRMIQIYGDSGVLQSEREQVIEPLSHGNSRYYLAHAPRQAMLKWYEDNKDGFNAISPARLLAQAERLSVPGLLPDKTLTVLAAFEQQVPFVEMGAWKRQQLAKAQFDADSDTVHDEKSCKWAYPQVVRDIDANVLQWSETYRKPPTRYFQSNPYRTEALRDVAPLSFDPKNKEQLAAMLAFNNSRRGQACPVFTAENIVPKPYKSPRPPIEANALKQCPQ